MQFQHFGVEVPGVLQRAVRLRDLAPAGQEHQHVAGMPGQHVQHRAPHLVLQGLVAAGREVRHLDRERAPAGGQPRRIQERRQPLAVQGGRHHHDAQVLAQAALHVQRQC